MSIKFKSFHDQTVTKYRSNNSIFGYSSYTTTDWATEQVEKFIKENNITAYNINDIKFSVDSKGNEHILLVYEVPEE
jgi:hypothetical protein